MRMPAGTEPLEMRLRRMLKESVLRGHLEVTLTVERGLRPSAQFDRDLLQGYIAAFRAARSPAGLARRLAKTVISTYGRDHAVASTLYYRMTMPGKVGRQMQTWVRFPEGWRVVAAHVSVIDETN